MNIHAGLIEHHVRGLAKRLRSQIEAAATGRVDDVSAHSVAFVVHCVKTMLGLDDDTALEALTEGGNDFGVDALVMGDVMDGEFLVTLVQGKYNHKNLEGTKGFPQAGVEKAVQAVRSLFNPGVVVELNPRLRASIAEVHALILDGNIPRVRFLLCNNGARWSPEAEAILEREGFRDSAVFEHVNHDVLVGVLLATKPVNDTITFVGEALVEDYNYARVFLGKVKVAELSRLMTTHGDRLLERNIRRFLGLAGNRVNEAIAATLRDPEERENFVFYNNGVTLVCDRFDHNALQRGDYKVRVEGLQILNGGQTSKTIQETLYPRQPSLFPVDIADYDKAFVLVRLYQVPQERKTFVHRITYATNNQNPVDLKDLRANDACQRKLEMSIAELGYHYHRKRSEGGLTAHDITAGTAAEAVLSVWNGRPHLAKFRSSEHFGRMYDNIFSDELTGAQVVAAVLLLRIAEGRRKRPREDDPELVRYASYWAAMLMGRALLRDMGMGLAQLDHRKFAAAKELIQSAGERYYAEAIATLEVAVRELYGDQKLWLSRLAATFRRGDLLEVLPSQLR